jgi:hypothetical protein
MCNAHLTHLAAKALVQLEWFTHTPVPVSGSTSKHTSKLLQLHTQPERPQLR